MILRTLLLAALLIARLGSRPISRLPLFAGESVDISKTAAYWNQIIRYVCEKSGVNLELKIGRTSADTTAYVLAQEVEFVFSTTCSVRSAISWAGRFSVAGGRRRCTARSLCRSIRQSPVWKI
jgi:hypothetical protein